MAEQCTKRRSKSGKPFGRRRLGSSEKTKYMKICLKEPTFELWRSLREEIGFETDNDLALVLISSYKRQAER